MLRPIVQLTAICLLLLACSAKRPPITTTNTKPTTQTNTKSKPATISWYLSDRLMPVLEEAQRSNKPVFVVFHAEWCAPCKVMEEELFTQNTVSEHMNANFINFNIDYDQTAGRTIADIYEVHALPTVLFLDPKGVLLLKYTGGIGTAAAMIGMANEALGKF
jgi:thiol:disulfide interchange protein